MAQTLKHKRSSVVSNGTPKLPTTDQIAVGEIAINFAEGYETLSTRNSNNHIATFSSDSVLDKKYISSGNVVTAISSLSGTIVENERVIAQAFNDQNDRIEALEDAGYITEYTETDPTVPSWAKQSSKPSYTASEVGALPTGTTLDNIADGSTRKLSDYSLTGHSHDYLPLSGGTVTGNIKISGSTNYLRVINGGNSKTATLYGDRLSLGNIILMNPNAASVMGANNIVFQQKDGTVALLTDVPTESSIANSGFTKNALTEHQSLNGLFSSVTYSSQDKKIYFYDKTGSQMSTYVDATDFIKDGMVSSVTVANGNLVVSFNTEAGREDITLALTQIFNPSNYYDKTAADAKFLSAYTETDPTVPAWAKASTKPSYTASEVGAMATSERSNYLPTGTTLDSVADGTTRKLSDYSLTGHSHTASEVGALPTGTTLDGIADGTTRKLSNYSLTGHSHTAAEVGAMATSERNNYLPTGTTLDNIADGTTRKLSNYSLTGHTHDNYSLTSHTHTAAEVGALPDTTDIPTEAKIANSGFTKNIGTLTGVTINGSAATVSNGNAAFNIELGGGSGSGLPTVSASDNGKILQVVNGQWSLVTPTVVYTGNGTPDNLLGNNGDIYLQTS